MKNAKLIGLPKKIFGFTALLAVIVIAVLLFKCASKKNIPVPLVADTVALQEENIKIFVINLERSIDRYWEIDMSLGENGFSFEKFNAVDGYLLEITDNNGSKFSGREFKDNPKLMSQKNHYTIHCPSESVEYYPDYSKYPRILGAGELGAYCSHREIWYKMVQENIPYALILEDDSVFKKKFRKRFLKTISTLPSDWDMIYLFLLYIRDKTFPTVVNNSSFKKLGTNGLGFVGATAYIISLPTAKLFLNTSKEFYFPIDHVMEHTIVSKKLGAYYVVPSLTIPVGGGGKSDIQEMK